MDLELLSLLAPIEWVGDRLLLADVKPRHIGRVVTFDIQNNPELPPVRVIGTLDGVDGDRFIVTGDIYRYDNMSNIKVWRRAVRK